MLRKLTKWIYIDWLGWTIEGHFPDMDVIPKYIVVAAPHTSNWDLPLGIATRIMERSPVGFVGKKSLFRFPYGWLFRWMGGVPVDRSRSTNYVDAVIQVFNERERFAICIAPEGTRKKVDRLRTGFYWIARGAGIPLMLTSLNYEDRILKISEPFYPTEDADADMAFILDYFRGVKGKNPENSIYF